MNGEFHLRDHKLFEAGCKHVYFCLKVLTCAVGRLICFCLKWSNEELQFLVLPCLLHRSALEVVA